MSKEAKINCEIFQRQKPVIKDIIDKINQAKRAQEKAGFAEDLRKEVDMLLFCHDFKRENLDCESCHFIASLQKKTAGLIIKVKKLV
ncbi:MAG: hypothetical protein ABIC68_04405 [Candidatus Omnitrophota bacterium]